MLTDKHLYTVWSALFAIRRYRESLSLKLWEENNIPINDFKIIRCGVNCLLHNYSCSFVLSVPVTIPFSFMMLFIWQVIFISFFFMNLFDFYNISLFYSQPFFLWYTYEWFFCLIFLAWVVTVLYTKHFSLLLSQLFTRIFPITGWALFLTRPLIFPFYHIYLFGIGASARHGSTCFREYFHHIFHFL